MDKKLPTYRPGTLNALKAVLPVMAMAAPLVNASIRPASISRNGLNTRAAISQYEKAETGQKSQAFSAFGNNHYVKPAVSNVDSEALAFLRENNFLAGGDNVVGDTTGDINGLSGRKSFLSCVTAGGAPAYYTTGDPIISDSICTAIGYTWTDGDNLPPVFPTDNPGVFLTDISLAVGGNITLDFEIEDPPITGANYLDVINVTVASDNQNAIRNADLSVTRDPGTSPGNLFYLTIANVVGQGGANITVTATDDNGNSATDTFFVNTGVVPSMADSAIAIAVLEDSGSNAVNTSNFAASDSDSGQTLAWTASGATKGTAQSSGTASTPTTNGTPSSVTYTPALNVTGNDSFTVAVNDGIDTDSRTVNVTITAVNDKPSFTMAASYDVSGTGGAPVNASPNPFASASPGGGADEAGQTFTYNITETSDPSGVISGLTISPTGTLSFIPAADVEGSAIFDVSVTDSGGTANGGDDTSGTQTLTINVDTLAPVISETTAVTTPSTDKTPDVLLNISESGTLSVGGGCGSPQEGSVAAGPVSVTLTAADNTSDLADGTYNCTVSVQDSAGNTGTLNLSEFYIVSDLTPPTVSSVTVPVAGTYNSTDTLEFTVNLDEAVNVTGSPALNLTVGSTTRKARYSSGSGTSSLVFSVPLSAGDEDADGISVDSLTLEGGTINDAAGNALNLTLSNVGATSGVLVDGISPVIDSVSVPASGTYIAGNVLTFTVTASESLTVAGGTPYLELMVGTQLRQATLSDVSGATLTFTYTVIAGDSDADGVTTGALVANGATLQDSAENDLNLVLNNVGDSSGVLVDAVAPEVQSVSAPAAVTYIAGDTLSFNVSLSEVVTVSGGVPVLNLIIGGAAREAALVSGNGSSSLTFSYTVTTGDLDVDGITVAGMNLKGSAVIDDSGNSLVTALNSVADTSGVLVDAVAPTVAAVQAPADGSYSASDELRVSLTFSEDIVINTAGGTPAVSLTVGSTARNATYLAGASTANTAVFAYTVQAGENDPDGISIGALTPNGASIRDSASNPANLGFTAPDTTGVIVDALAPQISSVDVPSDATYGEGDTLNFTVNISEDVNVSGSPFLGLTIGSTPVNAVYSGGDGTSALTFSVTLASGLLDTDGISVDSISSGGSIADATGNQLDLSLNGVGSTAGVLVDSLAPVINSVAGPTAATYVAGQTLKFTVTADEPVTATGTPSLGLMVGTNSRSASLSGISGNAMTFAYTVQNGDFDDDGVSVTSLALNGGSLTDASGNSLNLTLNNIADTSAVLVDAVAPEVQSVGAPAATTYIAGDAMSFNVSLSEAVTASSGSPVLTLMIGGATREAALVSGSGSSSLTFSYTVTAGDLDADGITVSGIDLKGATVTDTAGNPLLATLNGVADTSSVLVDAVVPTISSLAASSSGSITEGGSHTLLVTFSENVSLNTTGGTPRLVLDVGGITRFADAAAPVGAGMTFTYTALAGDLDQDGLSITGIEANGGVITDSAGNVADLSALPMVDTSAMTVDAIPPSISALEVTAPGYAMAGETITLTAVASEAVLISGTPTIALDIGGSVVAANYSGGSGSDRISFVYTVQPGDNDSDGFAIGAISLSGGSILDGAGNAMDLSISAVPDTSANIVDTTAPATQSIVRYNPIDEVTASDTLTWRVQFSEAVDGVGADDFTLAGSAASIAVIGLSGSLYEVTASGGDLITLDGLVGLNLAAGLTVSDLAGNALPVTEPATDETYTVDNTAPAVHIQPPSATLTSTTAISYVVQYTDAASINLSADDIAITATGDAAAGSITVNNTGIASRTVTLSGFTGDGTLAFDIAAGTAEDTAGNASAAPATSEAFTVDTTRPTVSISAPTASPDPFNILVNFSESVTGFTESDLVVTGGALSLFSGTGATYSATVTPNVAGAAVELSIAADVAEDAATNGNEALTTISVDTNNLPTITISGAEIEGQTLAAQLSDADGVTGSVAYDWVSGAASVGAGETYTLQASDVGNQLSVSAVYTDDAGYAENVTSALTGVIISIEQNAWNNIGDSVGSPSTPASFDDYRNVGLADLTDAELSRVLSILNRAVSQQAATTDIDELSELEALVATIMEGQDDDEDGLPNLLEDDGLKDTDADGIDDRDDVDADNDGIRDNLEIDALADMTDDDADGIVNLFDFDQDGDGYPELKGLTDENLDGVIDEFDTLDGLVGYFTPVPPAAATGTVGAVAVAPVVVTKEAEVDTDGDGLINSLDIDADNDSVPDVIEAGLSDDNDDALVDDGAAVIDDAADLPDTDGDDRADFLQLLSNGTETDLSLSSAFSAIVAGALDRDGDGQLDSSTDVDRDGLMDVVDNAIGAFGSARDFDGDGIPNHLDPDDDNDNISDIEENADLAEFFTGEDADGDGIDDGFDAEINGDTFGVDENGNGVRDDRELPDLDGDGLADYLDDDADNDGIRDDIDDEIALPVDLAPGATEDDLDGDGVNDDVDASVNTGTDVEVASGVGSLSLAGLLALGVMLVAIRRRPALAVVVPLLLAAQAAKAENGDSDWSIGVAVGISKFDTEIVGEDLDLTDESAMGFQLNGSYHFSDELGVELALSELGDAGVGSGWISYTSQAAFVSYRPQVMEYSGLRPLAKVGVNRMGYKGYKGLNLDKDSATTPAWSLGADYALGRDGYAEFLFTAFSEDLNFYSVGFRQRF